jgi:hypothetical protein
MSEELRLALEERRHAVLKDALLDINVPESAMLIVSLSEKGCRSGWEVTA